MTGALKGCYEMLDEEDVKILEGDENGDQSPREVADFSLDLPRMGSQFTSPILGSRRDVNFPLPPMA